MDKAQPSELVERLRDLGEQIGPIAADRIQELEAALKLAWDAMFSTFDDEGLGDDDEVERRVTVTIRMAREMWTVLAKYTGEQS
jgi:hypothetical protein